MLACGQIIQPTVILSEIDTFQTSTCPALVNTDCGQGFIKGVNNPHGSQALICELLAAELGTWFGLKIPHFAIIDRCDIDIRMVRSDKVDVGKIEAPVFYSHGVDGTPRDGSHTFLSRLENTNDVARLVVFDTWIRNIDRHDNRYGEPVSNSDNLLYVRGKRRNKYNLVPIDHTMCFFDEPFDDVGDLKNYTEDGCVYGYFPEFSDYINPEAVALATSDLTRLRSDFVLQCINNMPLAWKISIATKSKLHELICNRAKFVVSTIAQKIVDEPLLPGL